MIQESEITIRPEALKPNQPIFPTSSAEYVNSLSHYYRGELARMMSWRDRLDRTTNWAITGAGAMLSVSLSSPSASPCWSARIPRQSFNKAINVNSLRWPRVVSPSSPSG